jgi:flavin-dependent dehydrogenase
MDGADESWRVVCARKAERLITQDRADVFVVGGGPAGLATAIAACQKGFSVTLADGAEAPIDKACGEGMMPETQAALQDLGVEVPPGAGYRFRGIRFVEGRNQVEAEFPAGQGIGIRRPVLQKLLIEKAERCGVKLLWKTPVMGICAEGAVLTRRTVSTRWIVGADGSGSRVRAWSKLNAARRHEQRIASRRHYRVRPWSEHAEIYWFGQKQAYVTPVSSEDVCVVVMGETPEDADFERALGELPELRERLNGAEAATRERGAVTTMHVLRRVSRGNVTLVGDASGGVDAITGEGLRLAFRQAAALAAAMEAGDLRAYERAHARLGQRPMWMGNLLLLLGRSPRIRGRVLQVMGRKPELFARLLAVHAGQGTRTDYLSAGAQLGWEFLAA